MCVQVQTQPLTSVALASWVWCTRSTWWWTRRHCHWLETSTSYRSTPHRYRSNSTCLAGIAVFRLAMCTTFILDNWPRDQAALIPRRDGRNSWYPRRAAWGPSPDVCPPFRGNESERENFPPGDWIESWLHGFCKCSLRTWISQQCFHLSSPSLELSIQCDVNQYDPHRSTSTQRRSLV